MAARLRQRGWNVLYDEALDLEGWQLPAVCCLRRCAAARGWKHWEALPAHGRGREGEASARLRDALALALEVGTPFCCTVDFDTLEESAVPRRGARQSLPFCSAPGRHGDRAAPGRPARGREGHAQRATLRGPRPSQRILAPSKGAHAIVGSSWKQDLQPQQPQVAVAEVTRMPCDSIAMFLDDECSSTGLG